MGHKRKPPPLAWAAAPNVVCSAARDTQVDSIALPVRQAAWLVRHYRIRPAIAATVAEFAFVAAIVENAGGPAR